jgi:Protein of unknown function (DUF2000)
MTDRCVIVVDENLPAGLAANAAAVLGVTVGARFPAFVGADFEDADRQSHPGLIPFGLPVLRAPRPDLTALARRAREIGLAVVDFPAFGQQTNNYDEFREHVARTPADGLEYLGLSISGPRRAIRGLTGSLPLLR